jgi:hypothetical protein
LQTSPILSDVLTLDESQRTITVESKRVDEVGLHAVSLVVSLYDYPQVGEVIISIPVTILPCTATSSTFEGNTNFELIYEL